MATKRWLLTYGNDTHQVTVTQVTRLLNERQKTIKELMAQLAQEKEERLAKTTTSTGIIPFLRELHDYETPSKGVLNFQLRCPICGIWWDAGSDLPIDVNDNIAWANMIRQAINKKLTELGYTDKELLALYAETCSPCRS